MTVIKPRIIICISCCCPTAFARRLLSAGDPRSFKALYRRGQAYAALQQLQDARTDLRAALEQLKSDPLQQQPIRDKLNDVEQQLSEQQQQQQQCDEQQQGGDEDGVIEDVTEQDTPTETRKDDTCNVEGDVLGTLPQQPLQQQPVGVNSSGAAAVSAASMLPPHEQMAQAAEMLRANPDMMQSVRSSERCVQCTAQFDAAVVP